MPPPFRCDDSGNIYVLSDNTGVIGLRKLSAKGEKVAKFDPSPDSHVKKTDLIPSFAFGRGEVYAVAFVEEIDRYVFVYDEDGKYKSYIKLAPGFVFNPRTIAVFREGQLFLSGTRYRRDEAGKLSEVPFTGIFKPDGSLQQSVDLEDDSHLIQLANSGDTRYTAPAAPGSNLAIDFSEADAADDGNVYLMRWTNPGIVYALSPNGEVVRRFSVDPGDPEMQLMSMHIVKDRLAALYFQPQTGEKMIKVVTLRGEPVSVYKISPGKANAALSPALACYRVDPERFTFLGATSDHHLKLTTAGVE